MIQIKKDSMSLFTLVALVPTLMSAALLSGCGSSDASDGTASEIAASAASGAANSSEGVMAFLEGAKEQKSIMAQVIEATTSIHRAEAATSCAVVRNNAVCSSSTINVAYGAAGSGCTTPGAVWTGNELITFDSAASCSAAAKANGLNNTPNVGSFTRTTDSTGIVRTANVSNRTVTVTTQDTSGFATGKTGGTTVTCGTGGCGANRKITIKGVHFVGGGGLPWDHTVSTDADIVVAGTDASRVISSGTVRVQHNLAKFTSVAVINGPLNHISGCCFPTSGSITSTISGGKLDGKTETISFATPCGTATFVDSKGSSNPLTLAHCL